MNIIQDKRVKNPYRYVSESVFIETISNDNTIARNRRSSITSDNINTISLFDYVVSSAVEGGLLSVSYAIRGIKDFWIPRNAFSNNYTSTSQPSDKIDIVEIITEIYNAANATNIDEIKRKYQKYNVPVSLTSNKGTSSGTTRSPYRGKSNSDRNKGIFKNDAINLKDIVKNFLNDTGLGGSTASAIADNFSGTYNTAYSGTVASNDSACTDSGVRTFQQIGTPIGGTVTAFDTSLGTFTFTPTTGFIGNARFNYQVLCNGIPVGSTTVTINYPSPTATVVNESDSILVNTTSIGNIAANDTPCSAGNTSYEIVSSVNGSVTSFNILTGDYTFTPTTNFSGIASFTYNLLCDGNVIDTGTTTITVAPNTTIAPDLTPASFDINVSTNIDPLSVAPDPEGNNRTITRVNNQVITGQQPVTVNRNGVDVLFELELDNTLTVTADGVLTGQVFSYTVEDDGSPIATDTGNITLTITATQAGTLNIPDANTINTSGLSNGFVNYGLDTDNDELDDETGSIVANTGSNSFITTAAMSNGDWVIIRTYQDALGTGGPLTIDKRKIPVPNVTIDVPLLSTMNIITTNIGQDDIANIYAEPDIYSNINDSFDVTLTFDSITHTGGTTAPVSINIVAARNTPISTINISGLLETEGVSTTSANIIATYFTGTINNITINFESLVNNYAVQSIVATSFVQHNYSTGGTIKSITSGTDTYNYCTAVTIPSSSTLYDTFGSSDNADGTYTIRFNDLTI